MAAPDRPRLLVVLGLPQPAGCELERVLGLCGAPSVHHPTLLDQHQRLQAQAGVSWQASRALPERWLSSDAAQAFPATVVAPLAELLPAAGIRVLQLPGLERLLPLWRQALADPALDPAPELQAVLVLRHPLEVAEALRRSHGWSRDRALLVWLQSTLAAEAHSRGLARVVLEQDQLIWDVDGALDQLERGLQLQLPERSHDRLLQWEQQRPEPPALALPQREAAPQGSPLLQLALELHGWLQAEAQGRERPRLMPEVITQQLAWADALYGRTLAEEQQERQRQQAELSQLKGRRLVRLSRWLHRDRDQDQLQRQDRAA